ncbi:chitinase 4-like [Brachionus plicatilis]|uniref:Chitinase 4-like n=1 Tax=Brachionus plicatilis TaxID=10195 RepID=A0A3M7PYJ2_BRAPC|nr:chitinase 4-like [Brachionus plicatilis]
MTCSKLTEFIFVVLYVSIFCNVGADEINCYVCNSNWDACGDIPNVNMIKYSKVPCPGPCKIWKADNIVYRGCSYDKFERNSNEIEFCDTELCNYKLSNQPIIVINPENLVMAAKLTTKISQATTKKSFKNQILCYECDATNRACSDPMDFRALVGSLVSCSGACAIWKNPDKGNILTRGCLEKITSGGSGSYHAAGGIVYKYCSTSFCNGVSSGFFPIQTTIKTTKPTVATTIRPIVATTSRPIVATTTKPGFVLTTTVNTNGNLISYEEFSRAITNAGYDKPSMEKYTNFVTQLGPKGGITTKREAAMFLSQILWESDGLKATEEYACMQSKCPGVYGSSRYPGKSYYGRGYIQLSWNYNYEAASQALYGDDRLLRDPDQVANNDEVAWATAFWFWKANVGSRYDVKNGRFGASTMAINGGLECNGPYQDKARKRFEIYKICMKEFNLNETPIENGCYN